MVRIAVVGSGDLVDLGASPTARVSTLKTLIRDQLELGKDAKFDLYGAPPGDGTWVPGVHAALPRLLKGDQDAVRRFFTAASKIDAEQPRKWFIDNDDGFVQLFVVIHTESQTPAVEAVPAGQESADAYQSMDTPTTTSNATPANDLASRMACVGYAGYLAAAIFLVGFFLARRWLLEGRGWFAHVALTAAFAAFAALVYHCVVNDRSEASLSSIISCMTLTVALVGGAAVVISSDENNAAQYTQNCVAAVLHVGAAVQKAVKPMMRRVFGLKPPSKPRPVRRQLSVSSVV